MKNKKNDKDVATGKNCYVPAKSGKKNLGYNRSLQREWLNALSFETSYSDENDIHEGFFLFSEYSS